MGRNEQQLASDLKILFMQSHARHATATKTAAIRRQYVCIVTLLKLRICLPYTLPSPWVGSLYSRCMYYLNSVSPGCATRSIWTNLCTCTTYIFFFLFALAPDSGRLSHTKSPLYRNFSPFAQSFVKFYCTYWHITTWLHFLLGNLKVFLVVWAFMWRNDETTVGVHFFYLRFWGQVCENDAHLMTFLI